MEMDQPSLKPASVLTDPYGRILNYLRIALTDRCNLRCTYCMPAEGVPFIEHEQIMRFEEILRLVQIMLPHGLRKIRVTGGEPLVRRGTISFLQKLRQVGPELQIHLTTNGVLLENYFKELIEISISGVNLSLDTLNPQKFKKITRHDSFVKVWRALQQVLDSNIPLKLNMVVQRGLNEDEIIPMADLTRHHNLEVRFIEQMPFDGLSRKIERPFTGEEILQTLRTAFGTLESTKKQNGTAQLYKIPGFRGTIGIISGYSRTFCSDCNRLRLTSTGVLKTCLYDRGSVNLKDLMRAGYDDARLLKAIERAVRERHKDGFEAEKESFDVQKLSMSQIGG
ncbi:GTP 3',8-cyclase MoaA [Caldithrix abyssi]